MRSQSRLGVNPPSGREHQATTVGQGGTSLGAQAGTGIEPGTFNWYARRLCIDLSGEDTLTRHLGVFAQVRNVGDATEDQKMIGPHTPRQAQFLSRLEFFPLRTVGLKGTYWAVPRRPSLRSSAPIARFTPLVFKVIGRSLRDGAVHPRS